MNGGWDKLARQQDAQCRDIKALRKRTKGVEDWQKKWDKRWKVLLGLLGSISIAIVAKIVVEFLRYAKLLP